MGPGQFVTHCVTNWVGQEERPHIAEVGRIESFAELRLETYSESLQDSFAVAGSDLPHLLILDDDAADFPVGLDHGRVDRLPSSVPGHGEDLADLPVEDIKVLLNGFRLPGRYAADGRLDRGFSGWVSLFGHADGIAWPLSSGQRFAVIGL